MRRTRTRRKRGRGGRGIAARESARRAHEQPARSAAEGTSWAEWTKRWKIWGAEKKMVWHCETYELGSKIGKLLDQIVF
jgi:hypothetical protein